MNNDQSCEHQWACPGVLNVQGPQGAVVVLPLYCARCAAVMMRIAPPPEADETMRARSKILQPQLVPMPGGLGKNR